MPPSFPLPAEQRLIRTFTGRAEQPIRVVWIRSAEKARAEIDLEGLEAWISGARMPGALAGLRAVIHLDTMIGRLQLDLTPLLEHLIYQSASAGELVFAETMGFPPLDLAVFRHDAARAASTMVGDLIQGIEAGRINPITGVRSRGTLEIIQGIVSEGFELGRPHRQSARLIREVIGLDDRRAGALAKYAAKLEAQGVPEAKRLRMIAAERKRKLQSRGLAVSRTESVRSASIAQDMIWQRALTDGQMPDVWEQEWVASPNAFNPEKCPSGVCKALHHARAPIGGEFRPGIKHPPLHPSCGCARRLRRVEQRDGGSIHTPPSADDEAISTTAHASSVLQALRDADLDPSGNCFLAARAIQIRADGLGELVEGRFNDEPHVWYAREIDGKVHFWDVTADGVGGKNLFGVTELPPEYTDIAGYEWPDSYDEEFTDDLAALSGQ